MRRVRLIAAAAVLLAGCQREPATFDDRYNAARQQLDASGAAIDREIEASASADAADAAGAVGSGASDAAAAPK